MLALEPVIKARLAALPVLTGWAVRGGSEAVDRRTLPAIDVRVGDAQIADNARGAVLVQPGWQLTLAVRRGPDAAALLDTAFAAVVEALHGWSPGRQAGRGWERLSLARVSEPQFVDEGIAGAELTFSTAATYDGQP